jgi:hypothetical protein
MQLHVKVVGRCLLIVYFLRLLHARVELLLLQEPFATNSRTAVNLVRIRRTRIRVSNSRSRRSNLSHKYYMIFKTLCTAVFIRVPKPCKIGRNLNIEWNFNNIKNKNLYKNKLIQLWAWFFITLHCKKGQWHPRLGKGKSLTFFYIV